MRPLRYLPKDKALGARIGGFVPLGQESVVCDSWVQYFGTFPVIDRPALEFSVFHRFDIHGEDSSRDIIDYNNRILLPSERLWVTIHTVSNRGATTARSFEARGIEVGAETPDESLDEEGTKKPYTESKVGGRCYLDREWLQEHVDEIEQKGYLQLLQIGMHGSDLIDGFPWDPGYLHVWARDSSNSATYLFLIEQ